MPNTTTTRLATITKADYPDAALVRGRCAEGCAGETVERASHGDDDLDRAWFLGYFRQHVVLTGHTIIIERVS